MAHGTFIGSSRTSQHAQISCYPNVSCWESVNVRLDLEGIRDWKIQHFLLEILSWWQVNFAKMRILGPTTKADWMFDDTTKA